MKENLFKFLNICKKIFFYTYAIFLFICFCGIFIAEIVGLLFGCYYIIILNNLCCFFILDFIFFTICIIYFNYYLYCVGKHMYNIINNENAIFKDYFMVFSVIPVFFGMYTILSFLL